LVLLREPNVLYDSVRKHFAENVPVLWTGVTKGGLPVTMHTNPMVSGFSNEQISYYALSIVSKMIENSNAAPSEGFDSAALLLQTKKASEGPSSSYLIAQALKDKCFYAIAYLEQSESKKLLNNYKKLNALPPMVLALFHEATHFLQHIEGRLDTVIGEFSSHPGCLRGANVWVDENKTFWMRDDKYFTTQIFGNYAKYLYFSLPWEKEAFLFEKETAKHLGFKYDFQVYSLAQPVVEEGFKLRIEAGELFKRAAKEQTYRSLNGHSSHASKKVG